MIANKYKLVEKLSQGAFGSIYKAENIRTREYVAIKIEAKNGSPNTLKNEAKIYQYIGKQNGFPQLKWFGAEEKFNYFVIDLLGGSLGEMVTKRGCFLLKTTMLLGIQILSRIQLLHEKYLLHRDIKPDNFLFGLGTQRNKLYLVDFGFAKRYNYNGSHIDEKSLNNIVGSPNFVSLNVHKLTEPSRRDDLESAIYIIIYLLYGSLDWFGKPLTEMVVLKEELTNKIGLPTFIRNMLVYVRQLCFQEKPNYKHLIHLLELELTSV
jgi:serine/threonine protein kinase